MDYTSGELREQEGIGHYSGNSRPGEGVRSEEDDAVLQLETRDAAREGSDARSERVVEVFDILNCGPRRAFAVRGGTDTVLIAHNCIQATARDLLCYAILRLRDAGFEVIMHVHDEIIVIVNNQEEVDSVTQIMCENPPWAKTLPIGAEPDITTYYRKG